MYTHIKQFFVINSIENNHSPVEKITYEQMDPIHEFACELKKINQYDNFKAIFRSFRTGESTRDETIEKSDNLLKNDHPQLAHFFREMFVFAKPYSLVIFSAASQ